MGRSISVPWANCGFVTRCAFEIRNPVSCPRLGLVRQLLKYYSWLVLSSFKSGEEAWLVDSAA